MVNVWNCINSLYNLSIHLSFSLKQIVCLLGFFVPLKKFSFILRHWLPVLVGEELQILNYSHHSWPLSSEGSLASHTCDMGHPLTMFISKDPSHSHLSNGEVTTCSYDVGLRWVIFEHPTGEHSNKLSHCRDRWHIFKYKYTPDILYMNKMV